MIKDIVLHLSADAEHDVAVKYAVSVAEAFGANLAAVTFAYEAVLPATLMGVGCLWTLSTSSARSPRRLPTQP